MKQGAAAAHCGFSPPGAHALAAKEHRVIALGPWAFSHRIGRNVVHHAPAKPCGTTLNHHAIMLVRMAGTHMTVCFVSGYFGFSAGAARRARPVGGAFGSKKIDGAFCFTICGTLRLPNFMGVAVLAVPFGSRIDMID